MCEGCGKGAASLYESSQSSQGISRDVYQDDLCNDHNAYIDDAIAETTSSAKMIVLLISACLPLSCRAYNFPISHQAWLVASMQVPSITSKACQITIDRAPISRVVLMQCCYSQDGTSWLEYGR